MITQDRLKELFHYSSEGQLIWKIGTRRARKGTPAGTPHKLGYTSVGVDGKIYLLHRLIFLFHNGYLPPLLDHIDRDRSNNRIGNLRPATRSQNSYNRRKQAFSTSRYRGVSHQRRASKWQSFLTIGGENRYLGLFSTEYEAARAFNQAVIENDLLSYVSLNEL